MLAVPLFVVVLWCNITDLEAVHPEKHRKILYVIAKINY